MSKEDIPKDHPRYSSLRYRALIEEGVAQGIVAPAGPIAHGRGEAFDYLLGEVTPEPTHTAIEAAAALLLLAKNPVLSVNGNAAVLAKDEIIALAQTLSAKIEVNVFYGRTEEREQKIAQLLRNAGAKEVLGVNPDAKIPLLSSARGRVAKDGIFTADVVLVMLEDGDRTEYLLQAGKKVIAIDLNPLSRTPQKATIALVDNIVRCLPLLTEKILTMKKFSNEELKKKVKGFNNVKYLENILKYIKNRLVIPVKSS